MKNNQISSNARAEADETSTAVEDTAANKPGLVGKLGLSNRVHPGSLTSTALDQEKSQKQTPGVNVSMTINTAAATSQGISETVSMIEPGVHNSDLLTPSGISTVEHSNVRSAPVAEAVLRPVLGFSGSHETSPQSPQLPVSKVRTYHFSLMLETIYLFACTATTLATPLSEN